MAKAKPITIQRDKELYYYYKVAGVDGSHDRIEGPVFNLKMVCEERDEYFCVHTHLSIRGMITFRLHS